ncbi:MAG: tyrosine-type recombinase/integrase [Planctomycetota bacterium]|nr:tyrosine-type recombinase/integrase [Planctomycetota bacterium]
MVRARQAPNLRQKKVNGSKYFVSEIWKPDGKRTTISFGTELPTRSAGDIYTAFGKWLKLYEGNPHKTLAFDSPYEAVRNMDAPGTILLLGDLTDQYVRYAEKTFKYTQSRKINPHFYRLSIGLRMVEPFRTWPVKSFGPDELRAVQAALVAHRYHNGAVAGNEAGTSTKNETEPVDEVRPGKPLTRESINQVIEQLRRMFAWAVGRRHMDAAQEQSFREVKSLRRGAVGVTDNPRRRPVTQAEFDKVLAMVNPEVADMMRVMWFAPARPTEVCEMRPVDFLRDDKDCWLMIPGRDRQPETGDHKTAHHGRTRAIPITARLQTILGPRIDVAKSPTEPLFSPKKAVEWLFENRWKNRKTATTQGNGPGRNRKDHPMITAGDHYTDGVFNAAVKRGCSRAGVETFTPYDLRRSTITRVRALLGKDAAATLAGHSDVKTTEIYLLAEVQEAVKAAKEIDGKLG